MQLKKGQILPPDFPAHLPKETQWLGGQGLGGWFCLTKEKLNYKLKRYSPKGKLECDRIFVLKTPYQFDINIPYQFSYPSHCAKCYIIQGEETHIFEFIDLN